MIPGDGEVIEGIASVDESAVTGESAPVIRESGGDRSAVTGGTRVLSDRIVVRIGVDPGESFLDRIIGLVEGAKRQKTPNEIALTVLLSGMTIIFLIACVTLVPFGLYSGAALLGDRDRRAARVPDPDHDRRPALRDRHRGHGPPDPPQRDPDERPRGRGGGRRGHDAARQDGHDHARQPHGERVPPRAGRARSRSSPTRPSSRASPTRPRRAARSSCWPRSATGCAGRELQRAARRAFVPFSAQTRMSGCDLDGRVIRKGAVDAIAKHVAVARRPRAAGGRARSRPRSRSPAARRSPSPTARACWASCT